jgi:exodeoxyribonuclease VII large subunit
MTESISLFKLNNSIKSLLKKNFSGGLWVWAEISEIKENLNSHCFLELVEKSDNGSTVIAKQRAVIWANTYRLIKPYFLNETGTALKAGIKILFFCTLEMHENYGLSLLITSIEPSFTVGQISLQKTKIINQLTREGIIGMNKLLPFPVLPQRLAVISSKTAAGYEDFCHQLSNNIFGFKFYIKLFEALMQGEHTENSIIEQLDKIYQNLHLFDVVVIIRGGGSTSDLSAFDSYNIAAHLAQFPLPVICGIGHHRDNSVLDAVASVSAKTPTAAAEMLIAKMQIQKNTISSLSQKIINLSHQKIDNHKKRLQEITCQIPINVLEMLKNNHQNIQNICFKLKNITKKIILKQNSKIEIAEKTVNLLSPQTILKRGYTLTQKNGKTVVSTKEIGGGDVLDIIFYDGKKTATVL